MNTLPTIYHLGCSSGKDSSALLLWAVFESGIPHEQLRVTFSDTGNEDQLTYAHIKLLHERVVAPAKIPGGLETLFPERNFFELALHKKRFPSRVAQFCTIELKIKPTKEWLRQKWDEGYEVVLLNGKRVNESHQRKKTMKDQPVRGFSDYWGCEEWMPLREWTLDQVLEIHKKHGIPLNPLYSLGANRVGCWPCINCGKKEIRLVAKHRPEKIEQIAAAEKRFVDEQGRISTFFHGKTAPLQYRTARYTRVKDGTTWPVAPIHEIVKWANTERGGKQIRLPFEEEQTCAIKYHACE
jgi:3'-phosphoadenosine 5'-phosphosulfate sulfotransferase (PAPS reductase)/FAD synthetase